MTNIDGKKFRIGSVDYTVEIVPKLTERYNLWGQVTYKDSHIQLDDTLSQSRAHETLIHEMTHAIFLEAGYDDHAEEMVRRIAKVLHGLLRDNDFEFIREVDENANE